MTFWNRGVSLALELRWSRGEFNRGMLKMNEQLRCACNKRAAMRSLSQPGELIYIWRDTDEGYLNEPVTYRFLLADEEELQYNNVRDCEIVSVWRDGIEEC